MLAYLKSSCITYVPCNHGKQATLYGQDSVSQSLYQNNGDKPTICISVALSIRTLRGRSHSSRGLLRRMESFRHSSAKLCLVWVTLEIMSTARSYNCKEKEDIPATTTILLSNTVKHMHNCMHTIILLHKVLTVHYTLIYMTHLHTCVLFLSMCQDWQFSD